MTDFTDIAVESAENQTSTKRGPRDRYYFCAAISGKKIVHEAVRASSPEDAQELFEIKNSLKAIVCDDGASIITEDGKKGGNGFYLSMGTGQSDAQRMSVTVNPAQLARRTTKAYKAQFRGWHVWGSGLQACTIDDVHFEDNKLVSIEFGDRVDPSNKNLPKPKLKKKEVIRYEDLESVVDA
jgi:hypothetical protein